MILISFFAYGAVEVLSNTHLLYNGNHWQYYFYWSAPFILGFLATKGWRTSRMWRRMMDHRYPPLTLSRGEHQLRNVGQRPSILEHVCAALLILSLTAILKIFSVQHIAWWIGSLVFAMLFLRIVLMGVRRP